MTLIWTIHTIPAMHGERGFKCPFDVTSAEISRKGSILKLRVEESLEEVSARMNRPCLAKELAERAARSSTISFVGGALPCQRCGKRISYRYSLL